MYKFILAIRYSVARPISYFAVAAIALCVFVVLVVITVLSGLTSDFKKNTHRSVGDCIVSTKSLVGFPYYSQFVDILEKEEFIEAVSPAIRNFGLINVTAEPGVVPIYVSETAEIIGIDAAAHSRVTDFSQWLFYNKQNPENAFKPAYNRELSGCVPGVGILFRRDSQGNYNLTEKVPKIKFDISCFPLTAKGASARGGVGEVNSKTFYYSDSTESGIKADWQRIYLPFEQVQRLCAMSVEPKRITTIFIKFKPGIALKAGCDKVAGLWQNFLAERKTARHANLLEKVKVQSWKNYSRLVIAAVETEQMMMILVFGMIGIITVFIIFVVFYMIISHKSKDIGILKSIGASNGDVLTLFLFFAFILGLAGSAIGAVSGWQFLVHINEIEGWLFENFNWQLWNRTMYAIDDIPNTIDPNVLAVIIFSAMTACILGALLPSWRAARAKPVDTLQVNQL